MIDFTRDWPLRVITVAEMPPTYDVRVRAYPEHDDLLADLSVRARQMRIDPKGTPEYRDESGSRNMKWVCVYVRRLICVSRETKYITLANAYVYQS